jgi:hypothetical protein
MGSGHSTAGLIVPGSVSELRQLAQERVLSARGRITDRGASDFEKLLFAAGGEPSTPLASLPEGMKESATRWANFEEGKNVRS